MNAEESITAAATELTSWISSMEAVEKLGKLHFCIDTEILQSLWKTFIKKYYLTWQEQTVTVLIGEDR